MPLASVAAIVPLLLGMKGERRVKYGNAFFRNSLTCATSDRAASLPVMPSLVCCIL